MDWSAQGLLDLIAQNRNWAPLITFAVALIDSTSFVSFILPATPILLAIGALVGTGALDFWMVWVGAALGSAAGSTLSWWVGHHFGKAILKRKPLETHPEMVRRATEAIHSWGTWAVLASHVFAPLTSVVFLIAGVARIPFWRFQLFNLPGVVAWAWFLPKAGEYGGYLATYLWTYLTGS
jgi:membrane protein DedA with SNARE-associated domain